MAAAKASANRILAAESGTCSPIARFHPPPPTGSLQRLDWVWLPTFPLFLLILKDKAALTPPSNVSSRGRAALWQEAGSGAGFVATVLAVLANGCPRRPAQLCSGAASLPSSGAGLSARVTGTVEREYRDSETGSGRRPSAAMQPGQGRDGGLATRSRACGCQPRGEKPKACGDVTVGQDTQGSTACGHRRGDTGDGVGRAGPGWGSRMEGGARARPRSQPPAVIRCSPGTGRCRCRGCELGLRSCRRPPRHPPALPATAPALAGRGAGGWRGRGWREAGRGGSGRAGPGRAGGGGGGSRILRRGGSSRAGPAPCRGGAANPRSTLKSAAERQPGEGRKTPP